MANLSLRICNGRKAFTRVAPHFFLTEKKTKENTREKPKEEKKKKKKNGVKNENTNECDEKAVKLIAECFAFYDRGG